MESLVQLLVTMALNYYTVLLEPVEVMGTGVVLQQSV